MKEAGYDGTPLRWMSTKEYFYNYNGSLAIKQQLEAVGFKLDLQVMDWATLVKRRSDPKEYDAFVTAQESYTHPVLKPYLRRVGPASGRTRSGTSWWPRSSPSRTRRR